MFTKFDKALAALISGFIAALLMHFFGVQLSPGMTETITVLVSSFFAFIVPNKKPASD